MRERRRSSPPPPSGRQVQADRMLTSGLRPRSSKGIAKDRLRNRPARADHPPEAAPVEERPPSRAAAGASARHGARQQPAASHRLGRGRAGGSSSTSSRRRRARRARPPASRARSGAAGRGYASSRAPALARASGAKAPRCCVELVNVIDAVARVLLEPAHRHVAEVSLRDGDALAVEAAPLAERLVAGVHPRGRRACPWIRGDPAALGEPDPGSRTSSA